MRTASKPFRWRLWIECIGIYVILPAGLALLRHQNSHLPVLPVLWAAAALAGWWLSRSGYSARNLLGWDGMRNAWWGVALRSGAIALAAAVVAFAFLPSQFLYLPRQQPVFWGVVVCLYPVLSVYPQGIVYRALFRHRYAVLWRHRLARRSAATVAFSLAHVVYLNYTALLLTLIGGWMFFGTFERTRSLAAANLEHTLTGLGILTLGFYPYFHAGAGIASFALPGA